MKAAAVAEVQTAAVRAVAALLKAQTPAVGLVIVQQVAAQLTAAACIAPLRGDR